MTVLIMSFPSENQSLWKVQMHVNKALICLYNTTVYYGFPILFTTDSNEATPLKLGHGLSTGLGTLLFSPCNAAVSWQWARDDCCSASVQSKNLSFCFSCLQLGGLLKYFLLWVASSLPPRSPQGLQFSKYPSTQTCTIICACHLFLICNILNM